MSRSISSADARALGLVPARGSKYRNKPVLEDGIRFASKRERDRYHVLKVRREAGRVSAYEPFPVWFLRQVPFHLPGNTKYVADFLVFWSDGTTTVEDVKGVHTDVYRLKKKLVEATYPIKITEV